MTYQTSSLNFSSGAFSIWLYIDTSVIAVANGYKGCMRGNYSNSIVELLGSKDSIQLKLTSKFNYDFQSNDILCNLFIADSELLDIKLGEKNKWYHIYVIWGFDNGKGIKVYSNSNLIFVSNMSLPDLSNFMTNINMSASMKASISRPRDICPSYHSSSKILVDNLKIWNHVVGDPENYSKWIYDVEKNGFDDSIHYIYSKEKKYKPVLNIENHSGVGYYGPFN